MLRHDEQSRSDKGKAGSKIGRGFSLGDKDEEQRAEAVHQQHHSGIDVEQRGHQHGSAEHGEHMLNAQWDGLPKRRALVDLDDLFHVRLSFFPNRPPAGSCPAPIGTHLAAAGAEVFPGRLRIKIQKKSPSGAASAPK